jgi:hypothetical protein
MVQAQPQASQELLDALDSGELTRKNKLPMNPTGSDLQMHISMLLY